MKLYDFNPDSDKPILHLAHANGFPPQTYRKAIEPLLKDFHVISLLARPLWGDTPPEWLKHWNQMADDLLTGLKEMGVSKAIGVGHSLGGVLTLYGAVKEPDLFTHVILVDPTMLSPKLLWQIKLMKLFGFEARKYLIQGALRRKRTWASTQEAHEYFRGRQLFKNWPDDIVRAYTDSMTMPSPAGGVWLIYPPEWEARIYQTIPTDVWRFAKQLRQPTLVIRGENSNTFTSDGEKSFRKVSPTAQFEVVREAGHLVPQERAEEVGDLISRFIQNDKAATSQMAGRGLSASP